MEVKVSINNRLYLVNPSTTPIDTTLNTFIRSHARLTGTKFMCLEGGCGVCLVNITGLKHLSNGKSSMAVNSCLWLIYACHGLNITTIESLGSREYGYHPIQNTLYSYNGSQCGYCSPAMIMNMYSLLEANDGKVTMEQVENSFGGNICRCTGYRPILDAFKSLTVDAPIEDIEDSTSKLCCSGRKRIKSHYRHVSISSASNALNNEILYDILRITFRDGRVWYRVENLQQLLEILDGAIKNDPYILVSGNTAQGVYRKSRDIKHYVDVNAVAELHKISNRRNKFSIGANVTLTEWMNVLHKVAAEKSDYSYCSLVAKHLDLVATVAIRNAGTIAGNLMIKHAHNEFPSDVFLLLETIGADINIVSTDGLIQSYQPIDFLQLDMKHKVILNVVLPKLPPHEFVFRSYKIMPRAQNAHAMINAGFLFEFDNRMSVKTCRICYGGINREFIHAEATEHLLMGVENFYSNANVQRAVNSLKNEIRPDNELIDSAPEYRRNLSIALFYRFVLSSTPTPQTIRSEFRSGAAAILRPISSGVQVFDTKLNLWPLTEPVLKNESLIQCSGEAEYTNDIFTRYPVDEELWCAFVQTTEFHEKIVKIDASKALKIPGVHSFYTAKDIPGRNSFIPSRHALPGFLEDESIFIDLNEKILYNGQPCGMIVANSMDLANYAASQVKVTYKKIRGKEPLISGNILSVIDLMKDKSDEGTDSDHIAELGSVSLNALKSIVGNMEIGTQFHYPMEPQSVICLPNDDGGLDIFSATQWIEIVQVAVSECLQIPENKLNMRVKRLGGGFGSKISRSSLIACACALACSMINKPVRFVMTIEAMMTICGKRYPCACAYELVVDTMSGKIRKLNNFYVEDVGYSLNEMNDDSVLSAFLLGYVSTKWNNSGKRVLTNTQISSWCRAPGTTESIAMIETIMEHIAHETKIDSLHVRLANMADRSLWKSMLENIIEDIDYYERKKEIEKFNGENRWRKRGIGFVQMKYPVEYIGAIPSYVAVHYGDGSVIISHGGIEMGQGINTKASQIAAHAFGISLELISVKANNNETSANSFFSAANVASDSVCWATKKACEIILQRLKPIRDRLSENATWQEIVEAAHHKFVDLTAKYTFIPSDKKPYFVYGCACCEVEWDALTGNLQIQRVDIIEDVGRSMSPLVDVGQVEGAFIMGIGYWLTEKYVYDRITGQLLTNRTWNYKTPGAKDIPIDFRIKFVETESSSDRIGVLRSKATGEPAVALAIVVVCALRHAMNSVLKDNGHSDVFLKLGSGLTPDQLCLAAPVNINDFLIE